MSKVSQKQCIQGGESKKKLPVVNCDHLHSELVYVQKVTTAKAVEDYQCSLETVCNEKSVSNVLLILKAFLREAALEAAFVFEVKREHIDAWINNPRSVAKVSTRKLKLSAIRGFFHFCTAQNYAVQDPSAHIEINVRNLLPSQKEGKQRLPFTKEEIELLISGYHEQLNQLQIQRSEIVRYLELIKANGQHPGAMQTRLAAVDAAIRRNLFWRCAVRITEATGLRLGQICQLDWASLESSKHLMVPNQVPQARTHVPISSDLYELLIRVPKRDAVYVFPEENSTYEELSKRSNFSVEFGRFLERLDLAHHSFADLSGST